MIGGGWEPNWCMRLQCGRQCSTYSRRSLTLTSTDQRMSPPTTRGVFIVIEGLDKSAKSTQAARLLERIQSTTKAVLLKFPGITVPLTTVTISYEYLIRPHDSNRKDDRRVSTLRIRARRPRHPPPLLRQPLGTRVRPSIPP